MHRTIWGDHTVHCNWHTLSRSDFISNYTLVFSPSISFPFSFRRLHLGWLDQWLLLCNMRWSGLSKSVQVFAEWISGQWMHRTIPRNYRVHCNWHTLSRSDLYFNPMLTASLIDQGVFSSVFLQRIVFGVTGSMGPARQHAMGWALYWDTEAWRATLRAVIAQDHTRRPYSAL